MSRDDQTDSSRDGSDQKRLTDPDVYAINADPFTLAEEKAIDPDAPGTASDYRGSTSGIGDPEEPGARPRRFTYVDTEDSR